MLSALLLGSALLRGDGLADGRELLLELAQLALASADRLGRREARRGEALALAQLRERSPLDLVRGRGRGRGRAGARARAGAIYLSRAWDRAIYLF